MLRSISSPSRNDRVTIICPVCRDRFVPVGRQRVCSPACRQAAYRRRHAAADVPLAVPPHRSRREGTVYECPSCETRYLGNQRCIECEPVFMDTVLLFLRRLSVTYLAE